MQQGYGPAVFDVYECNMNKLQIVLAPMRKDCKKIKKVI